MTDDLLPPEAKRQLWQKLRQIDVDVIARKEKALAQLAAQLDEVASAIPPAEARTEAAEAKAKRELQELFQKRDQLSRRQVEDMNELTRKRDALAAFCKSKGIEA